MDFSLENEDTWTSFVDSPFTILEPLWLSAANSNVDLNPLKFHQKVKEELGRQLQVESRYDQVPSLNLLQTRGKVKNKSLVRFRGMIQDMLEGEIVVSKFNTGNNEVSASKVLLYSDTVEGVVDDGAIEKDNVLVDRYKYYCVSIPGENDWVRGETSKPIVEIESIQKRENKEEEQSTKRLKSESTYDSNNVKTANAAQLPDLCVPLPINGPYTPVCLLKSYEESNFKLNDMVEIFGIVNFESSLETTERSAEEVEEMLQNLSMIENEQNYPCSLVPRIHCILINPLSHINPHVTESSLQLTDVREQFLKTKAELHALLTQALFGDALAAEYVLYALISKVFKRHEVVTVGPFVVNFSNFPSMEKETKDFYMQALYKLLSLLTTHSHYLPLSLTTLNNSVFVPRKDYTCNKLRSGILQLPAGTLLLIDETALTEGQLQASGVLNLKALKDMIRWQRVLYDFQFAANRFEYDTDVNVIVLSEGKSMIPITCTIPLKPEMAMDEIKKSFDAIFAYLSDSLLRNIRDFITLCKERPYELLPEKQQFLERELAAHIGQNNTSSIDNLHTLMTLTRLISVSEGNSSLDDSSWDKAKALELERTAR